MTKNCLTKKELVWSFKFFTFYIFFGLVAYGFVYKIQAQTQMDFLGRLSYEQRINDVWGYADEQGNEYALVGTQTGFSIVAINELNSDDSSDIALEELHFIPGPSSTWRDIKVAFDRAYVVNENDEGILICDLSFLPDSIAYHRFQSEDSLSSAHNIFIDEFNHAYVVGFNNVDGSVQTNDRGAMILDLNDNPDQPEILGYYQEAYVHDVYVRDHIMYTSEIYEGEFGVVDVTTPNAPKVLAKASTSEEFTHNAWLSDDSKFIYTTDEVNGAFIDAFSIEDLSNIQKVDRFQSSPGDRVVPHNVHVLNDFLIISYYKDGVVVVDANNPEILVEVERYDTSPLEGTGTNGCWGAYPFLPSGRVLATDRNEGLFVLGANYNRAAYLQGKVTDSRTGAQLSGVEVSIIEDNQLEYTNIIGGFKTGYVQTNEEKSIQFRKIGYADKIITGAFFSVGGETQILDIALDPINDVNIEINLFDEQTGKKIRDASVSVVGEYYDLEGKTYANGQAFFNEVYPDSFLVTIGKWNYKTQQFKVYLDERPQTFFLQQGYYDDFFFDYGWTANLEPERGAWVLDIPVGTQCLPKDDVLEDFGGQAYVTGNAPVVPIFDDVDSSTLILRSPSFDLTAYESPELSFQVWYCMQKSESLENNIEIFLNNGSERVSIDYIPNSDTLQNEWVPKNYRIAEFIEPSDNMHLEIAVTDLSGTVFPDDTFTKVGVDYFQVTGALQNLGVSFLEIEEDKLLLYPNPFERNLFFRPTQSGTLSAVDAQGRIIEERLIEAYHTVYLGIDWPKGAYILLWDTEDGQLSRKVVKM